MTSAPSRQAEPGAAPRALSSSSSSNYSLLPPIPTPLQRLFDYFPLRNLPANDLPAASPTPEELSVPALFIFTTEADAQRGRPSFNPSCLRWQTYLRLTRTPHRTVPSTNHASPSGALPFLLVPEPSSNQNQQSPRCITAPDFAKYTSSSCFSPKDQRLPFYTSLLESAIRPAWLWALYVSAPNDALMRTLYVRRASRSGPVQASLASQLRAAAAAEVRRSSTCAGGPIDAVALLNEARQAFAALARLLDRGAGQPLWFFASADEDTGPSLFDASVFAYTHLLLAGEVEGLHWQDRRLCEAVEEFPALVEHRRRLYDLCWGEGTEES